MQKLKRNFGAWLVGALLVIILSTPVALFSQDNRIPEGVYIKLTKDFYEALKNEGSRGPKVYSNNPSSGHLKEIAISTRFMVETNLQILRNQEQIIELLQALLEKK